MFRVMVRIAVSITINVMVRVNMNHNLSNAIVSSERSYVALYRNRH